MNRTRGKPVRRLLAVLLILGATAFLFHDSLFRSLGHFLVRSEPPQKVDVIVVLAGDTFGERIMKACQLVREGYAPKALVSGPKVFYGRHEDEFAIQWAVDHGCQKDWFEGLPNELKSTRDEAEFFSKILHERKIRSYILLTSNFHTRRAGRLFRRVITDIPTTVVAAPYPEFDPDTWWKDRQSRKAFAFEWMKTITEPFGV